MISALDEGVVVEFRVLPAPVALRRDVATDLDDFVAKVRQARLRVSELSAMLEDGPESDDLVLGVERAASRVRDGVLEEVRSAAEGLIEGAAVGAADPISVRAADVEVGVFPGRSSVRRHREVVELQRGVEELSVVITPLVDDQPEERPVAAAVRTPPDSWTMAEAFAELYR